MLPVTLRAVRAAVTKNPAMAVRAAGLVRWPSVRPVSDGITIPQFLRPMSVIKHPKPAEVAILRSLGIASMMSSRMLVTVRMKKMTPEIKTAPRAACQVKPAGPQT